MTMPVSIPAAPSVATTTTSTSNIFKHKPLQDSEGQIRLISPCLLNAVFGKPRYLISTFSLGQCPPYAALSYTWKSYKDDSQDTADSYIFINNSKFAVTPNLARFLEYQRKAMAGDLWPWGLKWLWADQICIDQSSTIERSHQVAQMSRIYSQARTVVVWLGYPRPTEDFERDVLRSIAQQSTSAMLAEALQAEGAHEFPVLIKFRDALFRLPYWNRLWIIQEVFLAKAVQFSYGSERFDIADVKIFIDTLPRLATSEYADSRIEAPAWLVPALKGVRETRAWYPLTTNLQSGELFSIISNNQCQDPRDRIYGIQSLILKSSRVQIDYTRTPLDVFTDAIAMVRLEFEKPLRYAPFQDWQYGLGYTLYKLGRSMGIDYKQMDEACASRLDLILSDIPEPSENSDAEPKGAKVYRTAWRFVVYRFKVNGKEDRKEWEAAAAEEWKSPS